MGLDDFLKKWDSESWKNLESLEAKRSAPSTSSASTKAKVQKTAGVPAPVTPPEALEAWRRQREEGAQPASAKETAVKQATAKDELKKEEVKVESEVKSEEPDSSGSSSSGFDESEESEDCSSTCQAQGLEAADGVWFLRLQTPRWGPQEATSQTKQRAKARQTRSTQAVIRKKDFCFVVVVVALKRHTCSCFHGCFVLVRNFDCPISYKSTYQMQHWLNQTAGQYWQQWWPWTWPMPSASQHSGRGGDPRDRRFERPQTPERRLPMAFPKGAPAAAPASGHGDPAAYRRPREGGYGGGSHHADKKHDGERKRRRHHDKDKADREARHAEKKRKTSKTIKPVEKEKKEKPKEKAPPAKEKRADSSGDDDSSSSSSDSKETVKVEERPQPKVEVDNTGAASSGARTDHGVGHLEPYG